MTFDDDDFPDGWNGVNSWTAVGEALSLTRIKRPEKGTDEDLERRRQQRISAGRRWRNKPEVQMANREKNKIKNSKIYSDPVLADRHRAKSREWYHKHKNDPDFMARQEKTKASETPEHRSIRIAKCRALIAANKDRYYSKRNAKRRADRASLAARK